MKTTVEIEPIIDNRLENKNKNNNSKNKEKKKTLTEFSKKIIAAMIVLWFIGAVYGMVTSYIYNGTALDSVLLYISLPMSAGTISYLLKSAFENKEKIKGSNEVNIKQIDIGNGTITSIGAAPNVPSVEDITKKIGSSTVSASETSIFDKKNEDIETSSSSGPSSSSSDTTNTTSTTNESNYSDHYFTAENFPAFEGEDNR